MGGGIKLKHIFRNLDYFGAEVKFRINNRRKFRSCTGGIATIVFAIFAIFYSIYSLINFVSGEKNAKFIFTNKVITRNPVVNLSNPKFDLAVGIVNSYTLKSVFEEVKDYLEVKIRIDTWKGFNETSIELPMHPCSRKEDFVGIPEDIYNFTILEGYLCPDFNYSQLSVYGSNSDLNFQTIQVIVKLKDSVMDLSWLASYMDKNQLYSSIVYINTGILYDNMEDPLPFFSDLRYTYLDLDKTKQSEFYLSALEFSSDENLLFVNPKLSYDFVVDGFRDDSVSVNNRFVENDEFKKYLHICYIKASSKYYIVHRTYQKIPELLAYVSGLLSQTFVLLYFFFTYTNYRKSEQKLMHKTIKSINTKDNRIDHLIELVSKIQKPKEVSFSEKIKNGAESFDNLFPDRIKKSEPKLSIQSEDIEMENSPIKIINNFKLTQTKMSPNSEQYSNDVSHNSPAHLSVFTNKINVIEEQYDLEIENSADNSKVEQIPKNVPRIRKRQSNIFIDNSSVNKVKENVPEKIFKRNIFLILFSFLCCCSSTWKKNKKILSQAEKKIFYYMDALTFIKKMQEVDILKYLLLSKDQLRIFKFVSKPSLSSENLKSEIYKEYLNEKNQFSLSKEEVEKICDSYQNLLNKEVMEERDLKLIELFDTEVNNIQLFRV